MSSFSYIYQKLNEKQNKNNFNFILFNLHYSIKFLNDKNFFNKYKILNKQIINNKLLNEIEKNELLILFQKTQKIYFSFLKLYNLFKNKYLKFADIDYDLAYNNLSEIDNNLIITLYHGKFKYKFRISDLINIINQSLCYMDNFIFSVQDIKNPWNNIPFQKSILYTIYFKIKESTLIMPTFFHLYFLSNFDKNIFYKANESLIKTFTLNNFLKNLTFHEKENIIKEFLSEFKNEIFIFYDKEITDNEVSKFVVEIFDSCIRDYIFMIHSNNILLIYEAKENFKNKIILISQKNMYKFKFLKIKIKKNFKNFIDNYNLPIFGRNILREFNFNQNINTINFNNNLKFYSILFFKSFYYLFKFIFMIRLIYSTYYEYLEYDN